MGRAGHLFDACHASAFENGQFKGGGGTMALWSLPGVPSDWDGEIEVAAPLWSRATAPFDGDGSLGWCFLISIIVAKPPLSLLFLF